MKKTLTQRVAALAFTACIAVTCGSTAWAAANKTYEPVSNFGLELGASFPTQGLLDSSDKPFNLDRVQGKPVLVNFFTKFCGPCIKEVPQLNQVQTRRKDLNVLAITLDSTEDARSYVKSYDLNWPVAANGFEVVIKRLNLKAFPAFALLDKNGQLVATVMAHQLGGKDGHATAEGIETWVDLQLGKKTR